MNCQGGGCRQGRTPEKCDCWREQRKADWLSLARLLAVVVLLLAVSIWIFTPWAMGAFDLAMWLLQAPYSSPIAWDKPAVALVAVLWPPFWSLLGATLLAGPA